MEKKINLIVEGGKATSGPPLGPALGPIGINAGQVVAKINEETKAFSGMKIPVTVIADTSSKSFKIEIGSPATSELVKKGAGVEKGSKEKGQIAGNIQMEKIADIARKKRGTSLGKSIKDIAKEVVGSCHSTGLTVNGKNAREIIKEINQGKHDSLLGET
ncbi:MAG: 50S ribosomal protein L11 [Candidatus Micrarchaeia archaeon]